MPSPLAISASVPPRRKRSPAWTASAPTIVAEALAAVPEPLLTALSPGHAAPAREMVAALARSLAPAEEPVAGPAWLWPEQCASFRRSVAAVRRYGGALLADPVGTGKTYVALAVAAALNGRRATPCFVPAALVPQWQRVSRGLDVPMVIWSHERVSRGALPAEPARFAIVDESHHYRNPAIRRYGELAAWLVGRSALLVSATPVVNRLSDLAHQLALAVRDDALAGQGVPSLAALLAGGRGHTALGHLVMVSPAAEGRRPTARPARVALSDEDLRHLAPVLEGIERLRLSTSAPIAALVRGALWRAASSSPAALVASLRRYRRLLLHARDAAQAGRALDRQALLRLTDGGGDQLLFWELLPGGGEGGASVELEPADLPALDQLIAQAAAAEELPDPKLARLRALLADRRRSLVFTTSRATVRHLRRRLGGAAVAWCTGEQAGIGPLAAPREVVLDWFRPAAHAARSPGIGREDLAPRHLITTDVGAEGLDLQGAERVVHYDLPWTPTRLDQREGRTLRAGSLHLEVELVRFDPPPRVEARLRQLEALARKRRLPALAGLGREGAAVWSWRSVAADRWGGGASSSDAASSDGASDGAASDGAAGSGGLTGAALACGVAAVAREPRGVLAGFVLRAWPGRPGAPPLAAWVLWSDEGGSWTDDPDLVAARLGEAAAGPEAAGPVGPALVEGAIRRLAVPIRDALRLVQRGRWLAPSPSAGARRLLGRLNALTRSAARRRDGARLALLHRAAGFVAGGHTAGEALLVERLAALADRELVGRLARLPEPSSVLEAVEPQLTGVVFFTGAPGRP